MKLSKGEPMSPVLSVYPIPSKTRESENTLKDPGKNGQGRKTVDEEKKK